MFEEYKKDLLKFYQIKEKNNNLSDNLNPLKRERLRAECIEVFRQKNTSKDKDLIKSVFDPSNGYEDQVRSIERFNLDRFRPLISFLKEEVRVIRDDKLIKLFAWLINFPTNEEWRGFSQAEKNIVFKAAEKTQPQKPLPPKKPTPIPPGPSTPIISHRFSSPQIIITCILALTITSISFMAWERMVTSVRKPNPDEKFMYWDGDHYEPVKEGEQKAGVTIIPLDLKLLQQQRKITLPDTLTKYSLGKVWYKGYGKAHEYFTAPGVYPPDTIRRLKPLSSQIIKYSSYDRYLLTRLKWFLGTAFFIGLCGYWAGTFKKEVKEPIKGKKMDAVEDLPEAELVQQPV